MARSATVCSFCGNVTLNAKQSSSSPPNTSLERTHEE